jgi:hypothetical protein
LEKARDDFITSIVITIYGTDTCSEATTTNVMGISGGGCAVKRERETSGLRGFRGEKIS